MTELWKKIGIMTAGAAALFALSAGAGAEPEYPMTLAYEETDGEETAVFASSGTCGDGLEWTLSDEGTLTISGTGQMSNYEYHKSAPWYNDKSKINNIVIKNGVTSVGEFAFHDCAKLTSITIPDSVTSIGYGAFYCCEKLTSITVPQGVTSIGEQAFFGCTNLSSVNIIGKVTSISDNLFMGCNSLSIVSIPNSVTSIGAGAFYGCKSLTSLTIPSSVTSIGNDALNGCTSLSSIIIPDSVLSIGENVFMSCKSLASITISKNVTTLRSNVFNGCTSLVRVTVPNGVTAIGSKAFYGCSKLTSVTLPESVASIDEEAFRNCTSLTSIVIPKNVSSISDSVFNGCTSLSSITLPDSLASIGEWAFYSCESLSTIAIPSGVSSIGEYAYSHCKSLSSVIIPDSVVKLGDGAFNGCSSLAKVTISKNITSISGSAFSYCAKLTSVTIPDGVTSIGTYAFRDCTSLASVTVPESVTSINNFAFYNCVKLTSINIPEGVTSIGDYTFYCCTGLAKITIPNSVTSIGENAFRGCTSLAGITIPDSVTSIGVNAFRGCSNLASVTLPYSVASISDDVFYECTSLKSVTIPNGVVSIGDWAFYGCKSLSRIIIPKSVISIGGYAFSNCSKLTEINFTGTKEQWDSVSKSDAKIPDNCTLNYNYKFVDKIELATAPTKKEYFTGDELDLTGIKVIATYDDGTSKELTAADIALTGFSSDETGTCTVTVKYRGKEATFDVIIKEVVLESISVEAPTKTEYFVDEELDLSGIKLKSVYNNGKEKELAVEDVTVTGYDKTKAGKQTITVTYEEKTAEFEITVTNPVALTGITVTAPTKTTYIIGEKLDTAGMKISATYSDKSVDELSTEDVTMTGFDSTKAGKCTVTVSYEGKTAAFDVTVKEPAALVSISVSVLPTKTVYTVGDRLDLTGGKIKAAYDDDSVKEIPITADMVSGFNSSAAGHCTVKVTYEGKTAEFTVKIQPVIPDAPLSVNGKEYDSISDMVKAITNEIKQGEDSFEIIITEDYTEKKAIKLPKSDAAVTLIVADGATLTLSNPTITAYSNLVIDGNVQAAKSGKAVTVKAYKDLTASDCTLGNVTVKGKAELTDVTINGSLKLSAKADTTYKTVETLTNVTVTKKITSNNSIEFIDCPSIGAVTAKGNITVEGDNTTKAVSIYAKAKSGTTSLENISVTKKITTKSALSVNGEVYAGGTVTAPEIGSDNGAKLSVGKLCISKNGLTGDSNEINLTIIGKTFAPGKVVVTKFKGYFDPEILTLGGQTLYQKSGKLYLA